MDPKLIALSGSLKGTTFPLSLAEGSLGRDATNAVCINDPSVSRRHCLIKYEVTESATQSQCSPEVGHFTITDLESYNGTFVNGLPITEQTLAHGDQIAVGDVVLLFLLHETDAEPKTTVPSDDAELITRATVRLRAEDAFYLRPDRTVAELPATARVARDLNTLLKPVRQSIRFPTCRSYRESCSN